MANPRRSIELLEELESLGFTDKALSTLHHFRLVGRGDRIAAHKDYCEKQGSLRPGGTNEAVQKRLELVLAAYKGGGFKSGREEVFVALAEAAWAEIPAGSSTGD